MRTYHNDQRVPRLVARRVVEVTLTMPTPVLDRRESTLPFKRKTHDTRTVPLVCACLLFWSASTYRQDILIGVAVDAGGVVEGPRVKVGRTVYEGRAEEDAAVEFFGVRPPYLTASSWCLVITLVFLEVARLCAPHLVPARSLDPLHIRNPLAPASHQRLTASRRLVNAQSPAGLRFLLLSIGVRRFAPPDSEAYMEPVEHESEQAMDVSRWGRDAELALTNVFRLRVQAGVGYDLAIQRRDPVIATSVL
ncbi:hypothetical protein EXIGLDRAFT_783170 [Exidia glandulosa HHB12029]|uniref:Uncharacterized protein n=1 Tax=Exidia glandulosa HHB12029 TaxID=1314781 RepID=A0A166N7L0_EXIGL|nr:hypothetical protein EXIGLDRAFT_783170 [Exidia glandulosa HHB12029]